MTPRPAARAAIAAGGLALATALVWWGATSVPFTYDDHVHVVNNPGLQAEDASLGTALDSGFQETRPLFNALLFAVVQLGGDTPLPFHLVGLLLHLSATLLAFLLARRLLGDDVWLPAFSAAALFGLHPLMAETVCYVNSLSGGLSAALYLAALLATAPGPQRRRPRLAYGLGLLAALGALLAKESAATLPLAILLMDLLFDERTARAGLRRFGRAHWPFLALAAVVLPLLFVVFDTPHRGMAGFETAPAWQYWLTQLVALPSFAGLWLWPAGQALIHQPPLETGLWGWPLLGLLAILAMIAVALGHARRLPALAFGLLFFLLALAPTNSLLPLQDFFSERFLYLPVFGLALAAGALLGTLQRFLVERSKGKLALTAAAVLVLAPVPYALAAVARVQVWQDPLRLWSEAVVESPNSTRARTNLARELGMRKRYAEALAVIDPAVKLKPDEIGPRLNRAAARLSLGDARGAVEDYQHATRLAPDWIDPWLGLARAAAAAGDAALAEQARQRCAQLGGDPIRPQAPCLRGASEVPGT